MANISLTQHCPLACDYCFARSLPDDFNLPDFMSRATFDWALHLLQRSGIRQVRLLGGEPTLHPQFPSLVEDIIKAGLDLMLFTNGQMSDSIIDCLAELPTERVSILVNAATCLFTAGSALDPSVAGLFRRLGNRIALGLNISSPAGLSDHILNHVSRYGLLPAVRLGLAHPHAAADRPFLHPRLYRMVGERLVAFLDRARQLGIEVNLDCGFVPCMFPNGGQELEPELARQIGRRCSPIPDILPDGSVIACFPLARKGRFRPDNGDDLAEIRNRFSALEQSFESLGIFPECAACRARSNGCCSGGCRAAAIRRLRQQPFTFTMSAHDTPSDPFVTHGPNRRETADPDRLAAYDRSAPPRWVIPYVDQPLTFWQQLADDFDPKLLSVYLPLPGTAVGSGRPRQPMAHLAEFLEHRLFPVNVLVNPIVLPKPLDKIWPDIAHALREFERRHGMVSVTTADLLLAERIRQEFPDCIIAASVLMDIATSWQAHLLNGVCDVLVPSSQVMRNLPALRELRKAFNGRIRLIVNEACLPGCPYRRQHFFEMGQEEALPHSLCEPLLKAHPWLRLTGAWVLPQHLHFYDGLIDEWKLAGRVTLQDPVRYRRVLSAYLARTPMQPHEIGGGPASPLHPLDIEADFFQQTLTCDRRCQACSVCREYMTARMKHQPEV